MNQFISYVVAIRLWSARGLLLAHPRGCAKRRTLTPGIKPYSSAPISQLAVLSCLGFFHLVCHAQAVQMEARIAKVEKAQEEMLRG